MSKLVAYTQAWQEIMARYLKEFRFREEDIRFILEWGDHGSILIHLKKRIHELLKTVCAEKGDGMLEILHEFPKQELENDWVILRVPRIEELTIVHYMIQLTFRLLERERGEREGNKRKRQGVSKREEQKKLATASPGPVHATARMGSFFISRRYRPSRWAVLKPSQIPKIDPTPPSKIEIIEKALPPQSKGR